MFLLRVERQLFPGATVSMREDGVGWVGLLVSLGF